MISLQKFISESNSVNEQIEQLRKEYNEVDSLTGKDKKDAAAKYGVSPKIKEIEHAILVKIQELRKTKKEFDKNDITDFSRLWDSNKQMLVELKKESIEFAVYLRNYYFEELKKYKLDKCIGIRSFNGYSFSYSDQWKIKRYQTIDDFIKNEDPHVKQQKMKDEDRMTILNNKLTSELDEFKQEYLKRVETSANKTYDELPKEIKQMEDTLKEMKTKFEERVKAKEFKSFNSKWYAEEPIHKYERKVNSKKSILHKYKTKKEFVDACLKEAENAFKNNVDALTHRVYEKDFDIDNIKISNVKDDPKIFKLMIEDGKKKLYCRSILAAQWSEKMSTHFRFIMTDRK